MRFAKGLLCAAAVGAIGFVAPATQAHFLQTDPVGYKSNLNLYGYVNDDPLDRTDPEGERDRVIVDDAHNTVYVIVPYHEIGLVSADVEGAIRGASQTVGNTKVVFIPYNGSLTDSHGIRYTNGVVTDNTETAKTGDTTGVKSPTGTLSRVSWDSEAKTVAHEVAGHGGGLEDKYDTRTGRPAPGSPNNLMNNDQPGGRRLDQGQLRTLENPGASGNEVIHDSQNPQSHIPHCFLGLFC